MHITNLIRRTIAPVLLSLGLAILSACASVPSARPVAATISATPQLSTLSSLIDKAGLAGTLNGTGSFTVFAPSNEAFKAVPQKTMDELAANPAKLKEVLTFHVIPVKAMAADVKNSSVKSIQGSNLALSKAGSFVTVEDAVVQTADIGATNGVVHVVDRVLMPPAPKP
jgi:uncharacterized surface protein with fasciclin (FAS1) repeats